jgi:Mn2+/Fe2+ NRAMP family transporter
MANPSSTPASDPYVLSGESIKEPPEGFFQRFRFLGPGFILTASIVGSGELIATTTLGARAGFLSLWIILFSCIIKVAIQLEYGKNAICHGETVMRSFGYLGGPKIRQINWTVWAWLFLWVVKPLQVGGVLGGVAIILDMWFPLPGLTVFTISSAIAVSLLVFRGYYRFIQHFSVLLMVLFTIFTLCSLWFLQYTPYSISWQDISEGLRLKFPPGTVAIAIGAFGLTGVAGDEIVAYHYWCLEKGYARYTGPRDDSAEWAKRAEGWIKVMNMDALVCMIIYTLVTVSFYLLGAAVLNKSNAIPEGYGMVGTLSTMYTEALGPWAKSFFMLGAFVVLFSTLFSALAAWTRIFSDMFGELKWINFNDLKQRKRTIGILAWVFPALWAIFFLYFQLPVMMITIGGISTSIMLLIVVYAAYNYRYKRLDHRLRSGFARTIIFNLSAVLILLFAVYGITRVF